MARINQELLARLERTLEVTRRQVYQRIDQTARRTMLDRHLAALVFARDQGINIQKYSTSQERAQIRGALANVDPPLPPTLRTESQTAAVAAPRQKRPARNGARRRSDNSVFVVHGRNEKLRKAMFAFLRTLGLKPLEWGAAVLKAKGANPYVGNILDDAMGGVQAVIVLLTPDDDAKLKDEFCRSDERRTEGKIQGQPRPNVLFEAGLALGRHPEKTLLVQVGKIRNISDLAGKHIVKLGNDHSSRNDFANRLRAMKTCEIDTSGSEWTTEGDFAA